jgi:hypothetical protein
VVPVKIVPAPSTGTPLRSTGTIRTAETGWPEACWLLASEVRRTCNSVAGGSVAALAKSPEASNKVAQKFVSDIDIPL